MHKYNTEKYRQTDGAEKDQYIEKTYANTYNPQGERTTEQTNMAYKRLGKKTQNKQT